MNKEAGKEWKKDFEYWLTNNAYINKKTADLIIRHVEHYYNPSENSDKGELEEAKKEIERLKELIEKMFWRLFQAHLENDVQRFKSENNL